MVIFRVNYSLEPNYGIIILLKGSFDQLIGSVDKIEAIGVTYGI